MSDRIMATRDFLREHQQEAHDAALHEFDRQSRATVAMACGSGKTRVGSAVADALMPQHVVVYLPSLALIRQTIPEWQKTFAGGDFEMLCVCSDQTVADSDEVEVSPDELDAQFGRGQKVVTTSPDDVRRFLGATGGKPQVVFSTYHSSDVVRDGLPENFAFDVGIFDEAHRTAGKASLYSASLHDEHTTINKRLFMTATPKHVNMRQRNRDGDGVTVFSMDNESIYGRKVYQLSIRQAIERKIISPYSILVSVVTNEMIADELAASRNGENLSTELIAHGVAVRDAMEKYGAKKVLSFHNSVAHAKSFATSPTIQSELAGVSLFHVSGHQDTATRSKELESFAKADRGMITNARCLTEGVDVPAIDMVTFIEPKKSQVDIIQAIGRALRLSAATNKEKGYILLPLFVPSLEDGGLEKTLKQSGYDTIWKVIQALKEQDELVREAISLDKREGGSRRIEEVITVTSPAPEILRRAIATACVDEIGEGFDTWIGRLDRYIEQGGNPNVPKTEVFEGVSLGVWISRQRMKFKAGALGAEAAQTLASRGVVFDLLATQHQMMMDLHQRYIEQGGSPSVPYNEVFEGVALGSWIATQRRNFKAGALDEETAQTLASRGVVFDLLATRHQMMLDLHQRYIEQGGSPNVPDKEVFEGVSLGRWIKNQRRKFKAGALDEETAQTLASRGVALDPFATQHQMMLDLHQRYIEQGGSPNVPRNEVFEGVSLGVWIGTQRQKFKAGALDAETAQTLASRGVALDPFATQHQMMLDLHQRYIEQGGSPNVPDKEVFEGVGLGGWIGTQRQKFKAGTLDAETAQTLASRGVVFDLLATRHQMTMDLHQRYIEQGGNPNVPGKEVFEGVALGSWITKQRQKFKAGALDEETAAILLSRKVDFFPCEIEITGLSTTGYVFELGKGFKGVLPFTSGRGEYDVGDKVSVSVASYENGNLLLKEKTSEPKVEKQLSLCA